MKKVLSVLLSMVLIFTVVLPSQLAFASQNKTFSFTEYNPYYVELLGKEKLKKILDNGGSNLVASCSDVKQSDDLETVKEASEYLRNEMVNREKSATVNVKSEETDFSKLIKEIFEGSYSQDIVRGAQDGDYLKFHWGSYKVSGMYSNLADGRRLYSINYRLEYYTTAEEEQAVTEKINETITDLDLNSGSDYIKIKKIHDFVCDTIQYDYINVSNTDYKYQFTTYGALFNGRAVCQGYATLFYRLCREVGIPVRVITSSNHAWNIVKLNDKYYNIDCTWDDTDKDTPGIPTGDYWSGIVIYKWFLNGCDDFPSHIRQEEYTTDEFNAEYPMASKTYTCSHSEIVWTYPENSSCINGFERKKICTNCEEVFADETISAGSSHSMSQTVISPTCQSEGYTHHFCTICGYCYDDTKTEKVDHKYTNYVYNKDATCAKDGTKTATCDYGCGETETVTAPNTKLSHSFTDYTYNKDATCTKDGTKTAACDYGCGETETVTAPNTKLSHSFTDYTYNKDATCTKDGTKTAACDYGCGETETVTAPNTKLNHSFTVLVEKEVPSTCAEEGHTAIYKCLNCSATQGGEKIEKNNNHICTKTVTPPTYDAQGYTIYTCNICGYSYISDFTSKLEKPAKNPTENPTTPINPPVSNSDLPSVAPSTSTITPNPSPTPNSAMTAPKTVANLKSASIKKAKGKNKAIELTWGKVASVSGYEIQVATDKKFKKNKKTVTIKKQKTTKTTVKKLKAKKKYYVRIRTYKTVNGKKVYSAWSKVKSVKTK